MISASTPEFQNSVKVRGRRNRDWQNTSRETKMKWLRYYLDGAAVTRAKELGGPDPSTLRGWAEQLGMADQWKRKLVGRKAKMYLPDVVHAVLAAYELGVSVDWMSKSLKISYPTIYKILRSQNVTLRRGGKSRGGTDLSQ